MMPVFAAPLANASSPCSPPVKAAPVGEIYTGNWRLHPNSSVVVLTVLTSLITAGRSQIRPRNEAFASRVRLSFAPPLIYAHSFFASAVDATFSKSCKLIMSRRGGLSLGLLDLFFACPLGSDCFFLLLLGTL